MRRRVLCLIMAVMCIMQLAFMSGCSLKKGGSEGDNAQTEEAQSASQEEAGASYGIIYYEPKIDPANVEIKDEEQIYDFGLAPTTKEGAILHAFCWSFNTIKESMADIAAAGYTSIQTSPINECLDQDKGMQLMGDGKWYYHYQPTDYTIGNYQLGTKDEFIAMCDEADKYGIRIIVDVAPNHTTPTTSFISKNLRAAVGGIDNLFHDNGYKNMTNYKDRLSATTYAMGGLPDIDTENPSYQNYMLDYLNDCIICGADGFRFDAAKHIALIDDPSEDEQPCNFWDVIMGGLANKDRLFTYGEVLQGDNERINAYIDKLGAATASTYGGRVRSCVARGNITVSNMEDYCCDGSTDVVLWVESHDNYINDGTGQTLSDEDVLLAWTAIAARKSGTPLFFARPYGSTNEEPWGTLNEIGAAGSPIYKSPMVSAVNHFRNAMLGEDEKLVNPEGSSTVLLIERGKKGLVILNVRDEYELDIETSLADGTYVNRVDGATEYTVSGGKITGTIPAKSAVILYNDGYREIEAMPLVSADSDEYYAMSKDTTEVTLHVSGADKAYYVLGSGAKTEYTDGTVITVGDSIGEGEGIKLTVEATNSAGFTSAMSYMFTKAAKEEELEIPDGIKVMFMKPASWKDTIYTYIYAGEGTSVRSIKAWPGSKMKDEGNGLYSFVMEQEWAEGLIMFNDGSNQYPKSNQPGVPIENGKTYSVN